MGQFGGVELNTLKTEGMCVRVFVWRLGPTAPSAFSFSFPANGPNIPAERSQVQFADRKNHSEVSGADNSA